LENKNGSDLYVFEGMVDVMQARHRSITPIPKRFIETFR
jgi:hypothetical protein